VVVPPLADCEYCGMNVPPALTETVPVMNAVIVFTDALIVNAVTAAVLMTAMLLLLSTRGIVPGSNTE